MNRQVSFPHTGAAEGPVAHVRGLRQARCDPPNAPLFSDRSSVPESVERSRIDDPTGEVGAVSREPLEHKSFVGDLRMRGDEAERARLLEAEARVVRGNAFGHDGRLACFFGAAERVPDQPCPYTDALAVGRTDIGVRLRILSRDPPSTPTQLSIT
jgi:hypothetical protein